MEQYKLTPENRQEEKTPERHMEIVTESTLEFEDMRKASEMQDAEKIEALRDSIDNTPQQRFNVMPPLEHEAFLPYEPPKKEPRGLLGFFSRWFKKKFLHQGIEQKLPHTVVHGNDVKRFDGEHMSADGTIKMDKIAGDK